MVLLLEQLMDLTNTSSTILEVAHNKLEVLPPTEISLGLLNPAFLDGESLESSNLDKMDLMLIIATSLQKLYTATIINS